MTYTLITRSLIIYIIVLFLLRLMGKRQIGEMQPFELVITLIIADLATMPMSETALPLMHGIIPIITLTFIHLLITFLIRKSLFFRKIINGKPLILINPDGIDYENLKNSNLNFSDLQENLRVEGYFNLEEILYAILQTNGTLTILPRAAFAPLTANDLDIKKQQASLPIILIADGKTIKENLQLANLDEKKINNILKSNSIQNIKNVTIFTIDTEGKIYLQERNKQFISKTIENFGGDW